MSEKFRRVGSTIISWGDEKEFMHAHTLERAQRIVLAVNNHRPLAAALTAARDVRHKRFCTSKACCIECEEWTALLADIDKEAS